MQTFAHSNIDYLELDVGKIENSPINLSHCLEFCKGMKDIGENKLFTIIFDLNNNKFFEWCFEKESDRDLEYMGLLKQYSKRPYLG